MPWRLRQNGQHGRFQSFEPEASCDDIARRAREVTKNPRRRRAAYAVSTGIGEPFLVAHQISGSRSKDHTHPIPGPVAVENPGIGQRFARRYDRNLITTRQSLPSTIAVSRIETIVWYLGGL